MNGFFNGDWLNEEHGAAGRAKRATSPRPSASSGRPSSTTDQLDGKTTISRRRHRQEERHPLAPDVAEKLKKAGLPLAAPRAAATQRNAGHAANITQQKYFATSPPRWCCRSSRSGKPFVLVYWSRDPDATQHTRATASTSSPPASTDQPRSPPSSRGRRPRGQLAGAERPRPRRHHRHRRRRRPRLLDHLEGERDEPVGEAPIRALPGVPAGSCRRASSRSTSRPPSACPLHEPDWRAPPPSPPRPASGRSSATRCRPRPPEGAGPRRRGQRRLGPRLPAEGPRQGARRAHDRAGAPGAGLRQRPLRPTTRRCASPARCFCSRAVNLKGEARDADAGDRRQLPLVQHRLRQPGDLRRRGSPTRRLQQGQGHARQLQPGRHPQLHGRDRPELQGRLLGRPAAGEQRRCRADAGADHWREAAAGRQAAAAAPSPRRWSAASRSNRGVTTSLSAPGDGGLRTVVNMQFVGTTRYLSAAGFPGRTVGSMAPEEKVQAAMRRLAIAAASSATAAPPCPPARQAPARCARVGES